jgi:hypothetical protein
MVEELPGFIPRVVVNPLMRLPRWVCRGNACIRWMARFLDEGSAGLADRSSRPQPFNNSSAASIVNGRL